MANATLSEVRKILTNYLYGMGLSPHNLKIFEYDANTTKDNWEIKGEFEDGFLGGKTMFEALFQYDDNTLSKFKIVDKSEESV